MTANNASNTNPKIGTVTRIILRPDVPIVDVRPTLKNPEISVAIGKTEQGYVPAEIWYPDSYSPQDIQSKVQRFSADYPKKGCPVCQKYQADKDRKIAIAVGGVVIGILIASYIGYKMTRAKECN